MHCSNLQRRVRLNLESLETRDCPATIHVNFAGDNNVAHPGEVSLRDAISASINRTTTALGDTGTGTDTIVFNSNLDGQTIVLSQNDVDAAFGPTALVIESGSITIDGPSAGQGVIINGDSPTIDHRIFGVKSGATLVLNNITLANGEDVRLFGSSHNDRARVVAGVRHHPGRRDRAPKLPTVGHGPLSRRTGEPGIS